MRVTKEINPQWSDYYKSFAYAMLAELGFIILDHDGNPLDNMDEARRVL